MNGRNKILNYSINSYLLKNIENETEKQIIF